MAPVRKAKYMCAPPTHPPTGPLTRWHTLFGAGVPPRYLLTLSFDMSGRIDPYNWASVAEATEPSKGHSVAAVEI